MGHDSHKDIQPTENIIGWIIDHACRIDRHNFKVFVVVTTCFAVIASFSRLLFRARQPNRFQLEDWLVLLGTVCLVAETGCVYSYSWSLYFIDAGTLKRPVYDWILNAKNDDLTQAWTKIRPDWIDAYLTLAWASIFSIKLSFLVLFHRMVQNVRRSLRIYFWVTVAITVMSGIVIIILPFALCPHFGDGSVECFLANRWILSVSTGVVCQVLDIATDLMIIGIPIILLRMSQLRFDHKLRIAMVLCLSLLCIILSIVRLAGGMHTNFKNVKQFSVVWNTFMLHCEAAVAVMTGSVPALRAVYRSHRKRRTLYATDNTEAGLPVSAKAKSALNLGGRGMLKLRSDTPERSESRLHQALPLFQIPPLKGLKRHSSLMRAFRGQDDKDDSSKGSIMSPKEAYHDIRREEQNRIRITVECSVLSEAASLRDLDDFQEVGNREWVWGNERGGNDSQDGSHVEVTVPARVADPDMINTVDPQLLGKLMTGMMM